jgi:hypothetical protein
MRRQYLARSILSIAEITIEEFIDSNRLEDKLLFIDQLPEGLLNRLYAEYVGLNEESRSKFSLKTDEEVKEVIDDIKK